MSKNNIIAESIDFICFIFYNAKIALNLLNGMR